jgi:hypothetical protein
MCHANGCSRVVAIQMTTYNSLATFSHLHVILTLRLGLSSATIPLTYRRFPVVSEFDEIRRQSGIFWQGAVRLAIR